MRHNGTTTATATATASLYGSTSGTPFTSYEPSGPSGGYRSTPKSGTPTPTGLYVKVTVALVRDDPLPQVILTSPNLIRLLQLVPYTLPYPKPYDITLSYQPILPSLNGYPLLPSSSSPPPLLLLPSSYPPLLRSSPPLLLLSSSPPLLLVPSPSLILPRNYFIPTNTPHTAKSPENKG